MFDLKCVQSLCSIGSAKGMQEITEIPDDYLNQSHVLKHLAKEIKIPIQRRRSNARDSGVASENTDTTPNGGGSTMLMMKTPSPSMQQQQQMQQVHQQQQTNASPPMVTKDPPQYGQWIIEEQNEANNNKAKSKSQPDLTKYVVYAGGVTSLRLILALSPTD